MTPHPECGHDVSYGPDNYDVVCCICDDNPCGSVTVEKMREHRLFDLDLFGSRLLPVSGGDDAPF